MQINADVNWDAFDYKFSGRTRDTFQNLAHILFCHEFNMTFGIFAYYNQAHIETDIIQHGNDYIGYQAKYYDKSTSLSKKTPELIKTISSAKEKYPNITRLIIYTNKEITQSSKKGHSKPQYQINIEEHGRDLGITIEWRVTSNFEIMLSKPDLALIRDYFFNPDGIMNYIKKIQSHSNAVLERIESFIEYHDSHIKIEHEDFHLDSLFADETINCLIIHGNSGTGKSGLIKDITAKLVDTAPFVLFRSSDFNMSSFENFSKRFGECSIDDFLSVYDDVKLKYLIIDSAEKIFQFEDDFVFKDILRKFTKHKWKIIMTIRTPDKDHFINFFLRDISYALYEVNDLAEHEVANILTNNNIFIPTNPKLKLLLCNLFYLKLYISATNTNDLVNDSISDFTDRVWNEKIVNYKFQQNDLHIMREQTVYKIIQENISNGTSYYHSDPDDALTALRKDDIIAYDSTFEGYYFTHDVFEEWVIKKWIQKAYDKKESITTFYEKIGNSFIIRKSFRLWIGDKLSITSEVASISGFLKDSLHDNTLDTVWKDEILIAMMSDDNMTYEIMEIILSENDNKTLMRAVFLMNTACKVIDKSFIDRIFIGDEQKSSHIYRFTKPSGTSWPFLFKFIFDHKDTISWNSKNISIVTEALSTWVNNNNAGITTKHAGLIALKLYDEIYAKKHYHTLRDKSTKSLISVILHSARENKETLNEIFKDILESDDISKRDKYDPICVQLLTSIDDSFAYSDVDPDTVINLAEHSWLQKEKKQNNYFERDSIEDAFGLSSRLDWDIATPSAFYTPVFNLLRLHPDKALDFVLRLINTTTAIYAESYLNDKASETKRITIYLPNGKKMEQIASMRLWQIYRGTSVAPHILECVLMALERWLLMYVEEKDAKYGVEVCNKLLSESASVVITSVVVSAVTAYPNKLFEVACNLLHTKEIHMYEIRRLTSEFSAGFQYRLFPSLELLFKDERKRSNQLEHRKKRFEDIILGYQINRYDLTETEFNKRIKTLHETLDKAFVDISDDDISTRFVMHRIDLRKMKVSEEIKTTEDGKAYCQLIPDMPSDLQDISAENDAKRKEENEFFPLLLWAQARYERNEQTYKNYSVYEENPILSLRDAKSLLESSHTDYELVKESAPIYVSCVLRRDFPAHLSAEDKEFIDTLIIEFLEYLIDNKVSYQAGIGIEPAIEMLPNVLCSNTLNNDIELKNPVVLMLTILLTFGLESRMMAVAFSKKMWKKCPVIAEKLYAAATMLAPTYHKQVHRNGGITPRQFIKQNKREIKKLLNTSFDMLSLDYSKLNEYELIIVSMMLSPKSSSNHQFFNKISPFIWNRIYAENKTYSGSKANHEYEAISDYIDWHAAYIFHLDNEELRREILSNFQSYINENDYVEKLLSSVIKIQDTERNNSTFWLIWESFYERLKQLSEKRREHYEDIEDDHYYYGRDLNDLITTYALAYRWWNDEIRSWHTLKRENLPFLKKLADEMGYNPIVLYSIARVLNLIGYDYIDDGLEWLFTIIHNNPHLKYIDLQINTEYYIEEVMVRLIQNHESEIKKSVDLKKKHICILDFLVERGSTIGFMLRENIT